MSVQAEVDHAFWHSPAPRHRLRQIIAARRIGQGSGCRPCCVGAMGGMTLDRCTAVLTADTVGGMRSGFGGSIRLAVLRLAAAAASQPAILTGGVNAVGICGVRCRACFLRQRRRGQHGEAQRQSHEQAQNSFLH